MAGMLTLIADEQPFLAQPIEHIVASITTDPKIVGKLRPTARLLLIAQQCALIHWRILDQNGVVVTSSAVTPRKPGKRRRHVR